MIRCRMSDADILSYRNYEIINFMLSNKDDPNSEVSSAIQHVGRPSQLEKPRQGWEDTHRQ